MQTRRFTRTALVLVGAVGLATSLAACGSQVATAEVGDCANYSDLQGELTTIPTVGCTEEHDAQFIHQFELEGNDYPGDTEVAALAEEGCVAAFEGYVGSVWEESELQMTFISPNENTWGSANDREVLCVAYLDGTTTTASFEGSGR